MKMLFDYVLEKQPWFIRWTFYLMIILVTALGGAFTLGWQAAPELNAFVDNRIDKWTTPKLQLQAQEFKNIHERFDDQKNHFDGRIDSMDQKLNVLIGRN